MTLILAPVSLAKSGARRCSGSAIWGPLNVRMLTSTPANWLPPVAAVVGGAGADVSVGTGTAVAVAFPPVSHPASSDTTEISATRLNNLLFILFPPLAG